MAATVKVYVSPAMRPVAVQVTAVLVVEPAQTLVPFADVVVLVSLTWYPVIAVPGSLGATQVIEAEVALATVVVGAAGVPGTPLTNRDVEALEKGPVPTAL